ncbi:hypothetical protein TanjilG_02133 [Lupinus angustifolius]|uniref:KNOX2 domain-containing protein n=1 Tax=Lupinus angustifolius TaxID=3871 RepID=A0A394DA60_LUPAN|nr:PREDICTED: homeobox protein knotted-1-like 2 [Lupinus angustifolius]OIW20153.1 hypothetical protein TanjilG_02133 [Lupinus angustifolius]
MESKKNDSNDKNHQQHHREEEDLEQEQEGDQEEEEENNEILKKRISNHPLYGLMVETHLECLKVGDISNLDTALKIDHQMQTMNKQNLGMFSHSELDLFMEAYCMALGQLKVAMEEPQQKSMAFINNMHSQLRDLTMATMPAPDESAADATSSSECKSRRNSTS